MSGVSSSLGLANFLEPLEPPYFFSTCAILKQLLGTIAISLDQKGNFKSRVARVGFHCHALLCEGVGRSAP